MTGSHILIKILYSNEYMATVRNKLDTFLEISETHTPNDEYEYFVTAHIEVASECIPTKPRDKRKIPRESLIAMKKMIYHENSIAT